MFLLSLFLMITLMRPLSGNGGHVVIFAPPLLGHISPLLDFARHLSMHHHVTYVVSASVLDEIEQRNLIFNNDAKSLTTHGLKIEFIGLFDNNTLDFEAIGSNPSTRLNIMLDRMREPISQLLTSQSAATNGFSSLLFTHPITRPINLIVSDIFNTVPIIIAHQRRIAVHSFMINSVDDLFRYIKISKGIIEKTFLTPHLVQQILDGLSLVNGLISYSIEQLDRQLLDQLHSELPALSNLTVRFVAPLMSETFEKEKEEKAPVTFVKEWLDHQLKEANGSSSVIYLSFGSIIRLDSEQIVQISDALSSYPVIWSLKATSQIHLTTSFKENQSHLILDWAPQRLIVLHPAIRLFISHGSWNSLLEAMSAGKPMLVWPRYGDQFRNAKRVEHQFKIGRMIENTTLGTDQRVISADELTKYLKEIFNREKIYLEQAQLMKQIISNARENTSRQHLEEIINLIKKPEVSSSEKTEEL